MRTKTLLLFFAAAQILLPAMLRAQGPQTARTVAGQGIFLVFPFENAGSSSRTDWLSEGLEELTIQRLSAAGQQVYSHAGRMAELERYGLPATARFSHATMLRIGAELDADYVVFGKFKTEGTSLTIQARLLRVNPAALQPLVQESSGLESLMDLHSKVVWKLLAGNERSYPLSLAEFSKLQKPLRLDAFEHYIRGLLANEDDTRLRELREATRLEPEWPDPAFALGQVYYGRKDCDQAIAWLSHVPRASLRYAEAVFSIGVCRLWTDQADKAETVFLSLQDALKDNLVSGADLPEILNNLGLARARQGKSADAVAALRRAAELDPEEDDYPVNLGLVYLRANEFAKASDEFRDAAEREPEMAEDRSLLIYALTKAGKKDEADEEKDAATETLGPGAMPAVKQESLAKFERIKTELDTSALQLENLAQTSNPQVGSGNEANSGASLVRKGRQELSAGRLDTAEAAFRGALSADPGDPAAHRGLADIARRRNKLDDAVKELQAALAHRDSAVDHVSLARIYIEQKKTDLAKQELDSALKLAPNYAEAKQLRDHLRGANGGEKKK
ncbi:MAG TPA: tetratricopeptide repeat protein [Candidatus Acidoferrum sp.]|nr:tetratricopeptide repeat protein [Candidatus Acidoferrum sp.]